jgi:hypothetical protein
MTTSQAIGIGFLLQYLTSIFLLAVIIVSGPIVNSVSTGAIAAPVGAASLNSPSSSMLVMGMNQLSAFHSALFTSASYPLHGISSPTPGVSLVLQYAYGNSHLHYAASAEHSSGIHSTRNLATAFKYPPELLAPLERIIRRYSFVVFLGVFILAFVIAAGVEETLKHFIVRCCPFTRPLKDPSAVLGITQSITVKSYFCSVVISIFIFYKWIVSSFSFTCNFIDCLLLLFVYLEVYLVAGALGFATFENIQYVFISGGSGDQLFSKSVLINELFVLLLRVLMPIHVICAVLQAINLSKVSDSDSDILVLVIVIVLVLVIVLLLLLVLVLVIY